MSYFSAFVMCIAHNAAHTQELAVRCCFLLQRSRTKEKETCPFHSLIVENCRIGIKPHNARHTHAHTHIHTLEKEEAVSSPPWLCAQPKFERGGRSDKHTGQEKQVISIIISILLSHSCIHRTCGGKAFERAESPKHRIWAKVTKHKKADNLSLLFPGTPLCLLFGLAINPTLS
jgi:hypothetical protein